MGAAEAAEATLYRCDVCRATSGAHLRVCTSCGAIQSYVACAVPPRTRASQSEKLRAEAMRMAKLDGPAFEQASAARDIDDEEKTDEPLRVFRLSEMEDTPVDRIACSSSGIDRVMGGGFVRRRTYCMFGPPGCGKSRFQLDAATGLCAHGPVIYGVHPDEEEGGDVSRHIRESGFDRRKGVKRNFRGIPNATDIDKFFDVVERTRNLAAFLFDSGTAIGESYPKKGDALRYLFTLAREMAKATDSVGVILMHEREDGKMYGGRFLQHATTGAVLKVVKVKRVVSNGVVSYEELDGDVPSQYVRLGTTGKNRFADATQNVIYQYTPTVMQEVAE